MLGSVYPTMIASTVFNDAPTQRVCRTAQRSERSRVLRKLRKAVIKYQTQTTQRKRSSMSKRPEQEPQSEQRIEAPKVTNEIISLQVTPQDVEELLNDALVCAAIGSTTVSEETVAACRLELAEAAKRGWKFLR